MQRGLKLMLSVRSDSATKRLILYLVAVSVITPIAVAAQNSASSSGAWSGTLVSSACNADEAFNESPECLKSVPGAQISLFDDTNRVMYALAPQAAVKARLGESVTVHGTVDGDSIQVASVEPMKIGPAVGEKAPTFSIRDQFGRVQTLEILKGRNGTVLLFFRSADW